MIFETRRLKARLFTLNDITPFHEMHRNPNVMLYTGDTVKTLEEDQKGLAEVIAAYEKPENTFWVWAVVRKKDDEIVGSCAILRPELREDLPEEDEIGFRFSEKYWGNGYASEIATGLIDYAFNVLGKKTLVAEVDELNTASVKILEKRMTFVKAYFSEHYQSNDRLYRIEKT